MASGLSVRAAALERSARALPTIRGIYAAEDEPDQAWKSAMEAFPNRVPRFNTKEACEQWMEVWVGRPTNPCPGYHHMQHCFTTLVNWAQVEEFLLKPAERYRRSIPFRSCLSGSTSSSSSSSSSAASVGEGESDDEGHDEALSDLLGENRFFASKSLRKAKAAAVAAEAKERARIAR